MDKQEKAVVTVYGLDTKGIISRVSTLLAKENINILDISQTIVDKYFTMMMVVDVADASCTLQEIADKCNVLGQEIGMTIACQHEDIFKYMHRI